VTYGLNGDGGSCDIKSPRLDCLVLSVDRAPPDCIFEKNQQQHFLNILPTRCTRAKKPYFTVNITLLINFVSTCIARLLQLTLTCALRYQYDLFMAPKATDAGTLAFFRKVERENSRKLQKSGDCGAGYCTPVALLVCCPSCRPPALWY